MLKTVDSLFSDTVYSDDECDSLILRANGYCNNVCYTAAIATTVPSIY